MGFRPAGWQGNELPRRESGCCLSRHYRVSAVAAPGSTGRTQRMADRFMTISGAARYPASRLMSGGGHRNFQRSIIPAGFPIDDGMTAAEQREVIPHAQFEAFVQFIHAGGQFIEREGPPLAFQQS